MAKIIVNDGDNLEGAIKKFRRSCENEGVLQDLKERQYYKKPSLEKKLQKEKAVKRMKRKLRKERRMGLS